MYTVSGAIILEKSAKTPPSILKRTAFNGTPRFVNFANIGEIVFLSESDQSILDEAYSPEFAADKMAVNITKFIISAAYGTPIRSRTATKGLSNTLASETGNNADKTTMVPTKKIINLHNVIRIAFGIVFSGFTVSPAATPINSVPENAKFTASIVIRMAKAPFGNKPALVTFENNGADCALIIGIKPTIAPAPRIMNITIANTLIDANQNSDSAKNLTVHAFNAKTKMANRALHIQTLIDGNHRCINKPAAVNSEPSATVQVSQYNQATVYPVPGPMYLAA
jgi:hypothetical protein